MTLTPSKRKLTLAGTSAVSALRIEILRFMSGSALAAPLAGEAKAIQGKRGEAAAEAGNANLNLQEVKDTVKEAVKEAVQERVKEMVKESLEES